MSYSFADLRKDVLRDRMLSPEYFGEVVTYKTSEKSRDIEVHCKHTQRFIFDEEGNEIVVEELTVTIDREDLVAAPRGGDVIYRAGDSVAFLYAYAGQEQPHYWRRVFERRRRLSQG